MQENDCSIRVYYQVNFKLAACVNIRITVQANLVVKKTFSVGTCIDKIFGSCKLVHNIVKQLSCISIDFVHEYLCAKQLTIVCISTILVLKKYHCNG